MRRAFLLCWLSFALTACKQNTVASYEALAAHLAEPENGFVKTWSSQDIELQCSYRPPGLLAAQDVFVRETFGPEKLDSLSSAYAGTTHFTLSLAKDKQDFENQFLYDRAVYAAVVQYLSGAVSEDIYLVTPDKGVVKALAVAYPRMYGATNNSTLFITFNYTLPPKGSLALSFQGRRVGLPLVTFNFDNGKLRRVPAIRL
ncbi:MAG TPA: hypothetical protein VD772_02930 [Anseongella sp.]|nr:hypothetical protein [Anseongella sp.]